MLYEKITIKKYMVRKNNSGQVCSIYGTTPSGYKLVDTGKYTGIWQKKNGAWGSGFCCPPFNTLSEAVEYCTPLCKDLEISE